MNCECGGATEPVTEPKYQYSESGLSTVYILNLNGYRCVACGESCWEFEGMSPLHYAILARLLAKPSRLSGEEIRFCRKVCGYSLQHLAALLALDETGPLHGVEEGVRTCPLTWERSIRLVALSSLTSLARDQLAEGLLREQLLLWLTQTARVIGNLDEFSSREPLLIEMENGQWIGGLFARLGCKL